LIFKTDQNLVTPSVAGFKSQLSIWIWGSFLINYEYLKTLFLRHLIRHILPSNSFTKKNHSMGKLKTGKLESCFPMIFPINYKTETNNFIVRSRKKIPEFRKRKLVRLTNVR